MLLLVSGGVKSMTRTMVSNYIDMACYSIRAFANDGTLDMQELDHLMALAESDGRIDADEQRVFLSILAKVSPDTVSPDVWARIEAIRAQLQSPRP
jgi:hypothetical protein